MNLDGKYKRLKFGLNFSPSYSTSNRVDASGSNGIVQSALMMPPVWPVVITIREMAIGELAMTISTMRY